MASETTIIVGAGQAGAHAAVAMRTAGLGGHVLLVGVEPHLPYERPPLSKAALTDDPPPPPSWFYPAARYAELDITLLPSTMVMAIDLVAARVDLSDGSSLPYDRLLLATGGRARTLPVPGGERVLTLRTLEDARRLREQLRPGTRVACIGAGVIGLEVAASAHARGCAVTVIEALPTALGRCTTPDMAEWIVGLHRRTGTTLHFGASVTAIEPGVVRCADGLIVPADVVVAGIGMVRNTELAAAAGLEVDNGILVDEYGRASAPGVFAAGDVAAFWQARLGRRLRLESWRHAQDHGLAVGRAMAGQAVPYDEVPWFWTDQHGRNIQIAGLPTDATTTILRGSLSDASFTAFHLDAAGRLVAATGVNAPREVRAAMALIRTAAVVDPVKLADATVKLQTLLPRPAT
jgi:3-phenylpropionate/trans-cinnamate dioxygenase ferredoxin reductase subunit